MRAFVVRIVVGVGVVVGIVRVEFVELDG